MTENNVNWDPEKGAKEPSSETPAAPPIYNIPLTPPPQVISTDLKLQIMKIMK